MIHVLREFRSGSFISASLMASDGPLRPLLPPGKHIFRTVSVSEKRINFVVCVLRWNLLCSFMYAVHWSWELPDRRTHSGSDSYPCVIVILSLYSKVTSRNSVSGRMWEGSWPLVPAFMKKPFCYGSNMLLPLTVWIFVALTFCYLLLIIF